MGQSLATKTPGAPDNTFGWYLQTSGGTLGSGFRVCDGLGNDTALWLKTGEVGIVNSGGFRTAMQTAATADRTVTWADADGVVTPELVGRVASNHTNSTTTATAVPGLSQALAGGVVYEVEIVLLVTSASTGTGVQVAALYSGVLAAAEIQWEVMGDRTLGTARRRTLGAVASGDFFLNTSSPVATDLFVMRGRGIVIAGTPGSLTVQLKSSSGGSQVAVVGGSTMRIRKL